MKACLEPGCKNPPFNEYCKYHQYRLYMKGGRLHKRKTPNKKPISSESKKRKVEHIRYDEQKSMFKQELKDKGEYYCFITKKPFEDNISGFATVHHLRGRTGDYYLDKEYWILARNQDHLDVFHGYKTYEELRKEVWWADFLSRLKMKDSKSYDKILRSLDKITPLNPKLFDEDLDI